MIWVDTIIQGILLGGLYALFAAGLSLVFGIMRLVNLAHGDLIVLGAYLILLLVTLAGAVALCCRGVAMPFMFAARLRIAEIHAQPVLGDDILPPLLGDLRSVGGAAERASGRLFSRQPAHPDGLAFHGLDRSRGAEPWRHAAHDLRLGARRDHRAEPAVLPHLARTRLPRDLRRSDDGQPDGHQAGRHSSPRPRASP
jgi:hypothetical protein